MTTPETTPETTKTTIDDDDDDLDDLLDDVLDDFSKPAAPPPATAKPTTTTEDKDLDDILDDDFAKQLAADMEELVSGMDGGDEVKQTFEKIWRSFDDQTKLDPSAEPPSSSSSSSKGAGLAATSSSAGKSKSFQETIAQTINKLKDSSVQVDTEIENPDAMMAEMMKQMEALADNGDFANVLEGMMEQLMSKDLLYEPMKDLAAKYPQWLADNKDKVSAEDYERYERQHEYVQQIVARYEAPGFDDKNEAQAKEVVELMQQMQDCGQPPTAILEGMEMGEDGMPKIPDDQCRIM